MHAICWLFKHRASRDMVWNDGQHFGRCMRCARELIRSDHEWRAVPAGYRIVWKDRGPADVDWSRWNARPPAADIAANPNPLPAGPSSAAPELKIVGEAIDRRDPASPGRRNDRRRAA